MFGNFNLLSKEEELTGSCSKKKKKNVVCCGDEGMHGIRSDAQ